MLPMKLKSFNYLISLLIIFCCHPLKGEEKIDIWKDKKDTVTNSSKQNQNDEKEKLNFKSSQTIKALDEIKIQESLPKQSDEQKVYGIYEPANYDLNLNMWSTTKAEDLRSSLKRLNKINLSKSSHEILEIILFSFSYQPQGMSDKEFVDLKINWLIKNNRIELIENFLKQNEEFNSKSKAVQFLVDKNIAGGNIKEGCEKIRFIDAKIKDAYLEKFKRFFSLILLLVLSVTPNKKLILSS